ncbi:MAG: phosphonoacetaldehyde hydrolase [Deltaproteobacteria bacterium]|nr:phosphonoacetaldehyde hydrolase [Deltaproteobacteria bacterium]
MTCRSYRGRLRAVILDWAGTTIDYGSCAPARAIYRLFERYRVPISEQEARSPMGLDKREHIRKIARLKSVAERWMLEYKRTPSESDIDAMYRALVPILKEAVLENAELIPGTLDATAEFRSRSLGIGSTSGYSREIMRIVVAQAKQRGFEADRTICVTDVPSGRPDPWMAVKCAMELGVFPMASIVKIGDTIADIAEGLNAGMWTIGVAKTGNELGLRREEVERSSPLCIQRKLRDIYQRMYRAGAHYVVDSIREAIPALDEIERRLNRGESPLF